MKAENPVVLIDGIRNKSAARYRPTIGHFTNTRPTWSKLNPSYLIKSTRTCYYRFRQQPNLQKKKILIFDFIYIYDGASAGAKKKVNEVIKKMESANLTLDVRR